MIKPSDSALSTCPVWWCVEHPGDNPADVVHMGAQLSVDINEDCDGHAQTLTMARLANHADGDRVALDTGGRLIFLTADEWVKLTALATVKRATVATDSLPVMLTTKEVCERLGVHRETVYGLVRRGELPATRVATSLRFWPVEVEAFLDQQRVATA